jgi:peroxiredoxin
MNRPWVRRWGAAAAIVLATGVLAYQLGGRLDVPPPVTSGARAPQFVANTIDRRSARRSLSDYAGHPLIVNVWATWCDPCRDEMPSFERLYRGYRERGLRIVAISVDDAGSEQLIRDFVQEHHLTFDILHDPAAAILRQYQVRGVPQTFLISRGGEIIATRFSGDWSSAANRTLVDSLMDIRGS